MQKFERIFLILFLASLLLKATGTPGGDLLLTLTCTVLASIYYFLGIPLFNKVTLKRALKRESYQGISKRRILGSLGFSWSLSILCIGIMFKLLLLPGAMTLLFAGFSMAMIGLVSSSFIYTKEKKEFFQGIWTRLIPAIGLAYLLANLRDELIKSLL